MNNELAQQAESYLRGLLGELSTRLSAAAVNGVSHYIDHGEYEMAFEGLFLDIM